MVTEKKLSVVISEFYQKEVNETSLEKTQAEVLIYANTENKLKQIMMAFIENRTKLDEIENDIPMHEVRETINKRLDETIFDDDYLQRKVDKLSKNYQNEDGEIVGEKVYIAL